MLVYRECFCGCLFVSMGVSLLIEICIEIRSTPMMCCERYLYCICIYIKTANFLPNKVIMHIGTPFDLLIGILPRKFGYPCNNVPLTVGGISRFSTEHGTSTGTQSGH